MTEIAEEIFNAGDKNWKTCEECKVASGHLSTLTTKYLPLKIHLEDVFRTRAVTAVFAAEGPHFNAADNTITLPHTTKAKDAIDLVDGIIFESYNAIRKDQLNLSKSLSDVSYDIVAGGALTARVEAGTMTDYYQLSSAMDPSDRTGNMEKCVLQAKEATGDVTAHFLASPHEGDPVKRNLLPLKDERRLPTGVMYIYQNIVNSTGLKMRAVFLTKCGVPFKTTDVPLYKGATRTAKDHQLTGADGPVKVAAGALDALIKKNWPVSAAATPKRPAVLLKLIEEVQSDGQFTTLSGLITEAAFGFTSDTKSMAVLNGEGFTLKT